jgi:hypothetical protein
MLNTNFQGQKYATISDFDQYFAVDPATTSEEVQKQCFSMGSLVFVQASCTHDSEENGIKSL